MSAQLLRHHKKPINTRRVQDISTLGSDDGYQKLSRQLGYRPVDLPIDRRSTTQHGIYNDSGILFKSRRIDSITTVEPQVRVADQFVTPRFSSRLDSQPTIQGARDIGVLATGELRKIDFRPDFIPAVDAEPLAVYPNQEVDNPNRFRNFHPDHDIYRSSRIPNEYTRPLVSLSAQRLNINAYSALKKGPEPKNSLRTIGNRGLIYDDNRQDTDYIFTQADLDLKMSAKNIIYASDLYNQMRATSSSRLAQGLKQTSKWSLIDFNPTIDPAKSRLFLPGRQLRQYRIRENVATGFSKLSVTTPLYPLVKANHNLAFSFLQRIYNPTRQQWGFFVAPSEMLRLYQLIELQALRENERQGILTDHLPSTPHTRLRDIQTLLNPNTSEEMRREGLINLLGSDGVQPFQHALLEHAIRGIHRREDPQVNSIASTTGSSSLDPVLIERLVHALKRSEDSALQHSAQFSGPSHATTQPILNSISSTLSLIQNSIIDLKDGQVSVNGDTKTIKNIVAGTQSALLELATISTRLNAIQTTVSKFPDADYATVQSDIIALREQVKAGFDKMKSNNEKTLKGQASTTMQLENIQSAISENVKAEAVYKSLKHILETAVSKDQFSEGINHFREMFLALSKLRTTSVAVKEPIQTPRRRRHARTTRTEDLDKDDDIDKDDDMSGGAGAVALQPTQVFDSVYVSTLRDQIANAIKVATDEMLYKATTDFSNKTTDILKQLDTLPRVAALARDHTEEIQAEVPMDGTALPSNSAETIKDAADDSRSRMEVLLEQSSKIERGQEQLFQMITELQRLKDQDPSSGDDILGHQSMEVVLNSAPFTEFLLAHKSELADKINGYLTRLDDGHRLVMQEISQATITNNQNLTSSIMKLEQLTTKNDETAVSALMTINRGLTEMDKATAMLASQSGLMTDTKNRWLNNLTEIATAHRQVVDDIATVEQQGYDRRQIVSDEFYRSTAGQYQTFINEIKSNLAEVSSSSANELSRLSSILNVISKANAGLAQVGEKIENVRISVEGLISLYAQSLDNLRAEVNQNGDQMTNAYRQHIQAFETYIRESQLALSNLGPMQTTQHYQILKAQVDKLNEFSELISTLEDRTDVNGETIRQNFMSMTSVQSRTNTLLETIKRELSERLSSVEETLESVPRALTANTEETRKLLETKNIIKSRKMVNRLSGMEHKLASIYTHLTAVERRADVEAPLQSEGSIAFQGATARPGTVELLQQNSPAVVNGEGGSNMDVSNTTGTVAPSAADAMLEHDVALSEDTLKSPAAVSQYLKSAADLVEDVRLTTMAPTEIRGAVSDTIAPEDGALNRFDTIAKHATASLLQAGEPGSTLTPRSASGLTKVVQDVKGALTDILREPETEAPAFYDEPSDSAVGRLLEARDEKVDGYLKIAEHGSQYTTHLKKTSAAILEMELSDAARKKHGDMTEDILKQEAVANNTLKRLDADQRNSSSSAPTTSTSTIRDQATQLLEKSKHQQATAATQENFLKTSRVNAEAGIQHLSVKPQNVEVPPEIDFSNVNVEVDMLPTPFNPLAEIAAKTNLTLLSKRPASLDEIDGVSAKPYILKKKQKRNAVNFDPNLTRPERLKTRSGISIEEGAGEEDEEAEDFLYHRNGGGREIDEAGVIAETLSGKVATTAVDSTLQKALANSLDPYRDTESADLYSTTYANLAAAGPRY